MLLSHTKRLCIILPTLIAATPQDTKPTSSAPTSLPLPPQLQRAVPACAQPCLQALVVKQFSLSCITSSNLSCLCSRYSPGGSSLGELALGCIYASCPTLDSRAASAYNICFGREDAVQPTQTALTVTASSSVGSKLMPSTRSVVSSRLTTPLPTSSRTLVTSSSTKGISVATVAVDSISVAPSPTSSHYIPSGAAAAATAPSPLTMKPAQIAGLSIAAAATFILAISLMALSVFLRKRRERKVLLEINEKKMQGSPPRAYSTRFSRGFRNSESPNVPPKQFPLIPMPNSPARVLYSDPRLGKNSPKPTLRAAHSTLSPPKQAKTDFSAVHPLLRPGAGTSNNSSNSLVPLDQIGLAISAEAPAKKATSVVSPQPPRKFELKQQRPKSFRSLDASQRPDSVLTQDTVFEEDMIAARRRSSKLLPTPPIPIPPIRTFQPSRPPLAFNPTARLGSTAPSRPQPPQQPGLSLNIPIRHSRSRIAPAEVVPRVAPAAPAPLAPAIQISSARDRSLSRSTSASTEFNNSDDIPDYYFSPRRPSSKNSAPSTSSGRATRPHDSPKLVNIRPKVSSSTMSRTASRASTNIRDSVSSQTSFETVDPNDPTPEDEDDDKQLSDDSNKLSPVAESPISYLRYPKVPRASNQLVARSPKSPQSQRSQGSPRGFPEPSALLVKRRGEKEALKIERRLRMGSPNGPDIRDPTRNPRQHMRSSSVETWNLGPSTRASDRQTRVQSGQWPKSPAMYDPDMIQPLNIRSKQPEITALKSPAWVPRLTPTRQGDDLFISVTYSKPNN